MLRTDLPLPTAHPTGRRGGAVVALRGAAAIPRGAPTPRRLGELLLERTALTEPELAEALAEQRRTGSRLGEVLVHAGVLGERELLEGLCEHFGVPSVDLAAIVPAPGIAARLPDLLTQKLGVVPVASAAGVLCVAAAEPLDPRGRHDLEAAAEASVEVLLATRSAIDDFRQRLHAARYLRDARDGLRTAHPEDSAHVVVTRGQAMTAAVGALAFLVGLVVASRATLIGLVAACSAFSLSVAVYRLRLAALSLGTHLEVQVTDEELAALDERALPVYTLLLPLYHEANMVSRLVDGVGAIDYPRTKLDVKLLCEADDHETIAALRGLDLPPHFQLVVVPDGAPKTKPKACNYGLLQARGEYVVIFDGEDRPEPDQLKKAVVAFAKGPAHLACIQAKLSFFNRDQNLLTRWFAIEYAAHFDLLLPGLDAAGMPIPLGGTSNHFKTERLRALGAWDPFNVTEDADLGVRLHKAGFSTSVMDSTTYEEANSELGNWVRQRSRWCKGHFQTWLVHMRHPRRLLGQIGLKSFVSFNLLIGGTLILLLNPIFWLLTITCAATGGHRMTSLFPSYELYAATAMLFLGNITFVYVNLAGALQRGYFGLARYALLSPVYWAMMSWAAWKGALQLITRPFYWEKTVHGLHLDPDDP